MSVLGTAKEHRWPPRGASVFVLLRVSDFYNYHVASTAHRLNGVASYEKNMCRKSNYPSKVLHISVCFRPPCLDLQKNKRKVPKVPLDFSKVYVIISVGVDGCWCALRSSKPVMGVRSLLGGFDSHIFPPY